MQCTNQLKQYGIAIHNFHDTRQGLPPSAIGYSTAASDPYPSDAERRGRASFWVFILPYMEQTSLYDFVSTKSDKFRLGLNGTNLWNTLSSAEQDQLGSTPIFLCPSRRGKSSNFLGKTDSGDDQKVYGPQGDYAIVVGRLASNWSLWLQYQEQLTNNSGYITDQRGAFRTAIWNNNLPQNWTPRDTFAWMSDGTSNQIMIGEKLIYADAVGTCKGSATADRPYTGDCSLFAAGEWLTLPGARSFNGHINKNYKKTPQNSYDENSADGMWGSTHSGVCNFLLGDGGVRGISVTIPTGQLSANADSILAKLGNVKDGNSVTLP